MLQLIGPKAHDSQLHRIHLVNGPIKKRLDQFVQLALLTMDTTEQIAKIQQINLGHVIVDHELGFNVRNRRLAEMALIEPLHGQGPGTASITGFRFAGRGRLR